MAFVAEDGTGLSNANAFADVAFFKTYHDDRGNSYTTLSSDTLIQQVLVRASDYIQRRFGTKFVGLPLNDSQTLAWPRQDAYYPSGWAIEGIPLEVKQATAEYALRAVSGSLAPDPSYDVSNGPIVEREERAGPIVERYKFGQGGMVMTFRKYPLADSLLAPLLVGGGSTFLLRA